MAPPTAPIIAPTAILATKVPPKAPINAGAAKADKAIDPAIAPSAINPPSAYCNHSGICPLGSAYIIGLFIQ